MKRSIVVLAGIVVGAGGLVALSIVQKLAIDAPLAAGGFLVPCIVGGGFGAIFVLHRDQAARQEERIRALARRCERLAACHGDANGVADKRSGPRDAVVATTAATRVKELVHEVGQPLYAISNYAQASIDTLDTDDQRQRSVAGWSREILLQTERAAAIIRRLTVLINPTVAESRDELRDLVVGACRSVVEQYGGSVTADGEQVDGLTINCHFDRFPEKQIRVEEKP